ncbi:hypothetical protein HCG53_30305, partial [Pseudomonas brassicacearum]|nr:hypothetical protein [Pseudomonas brassicacearum]
AIASKLAPTGGGSAAIQMWEEQKAQETMAIQTQIMATQATLQTLQAALLQAMTVSIDTHA